MNSAIRTSAAQAAPPKHAPTPATVCAVCLAAAVRPEDGPALTGVSREELKLASKAARGALAALKRNGRGAPDFGRTQALIIEEILRLEAGLLLSDAPGAPGGAL